MVAQIANDTLFAEDVALLVYFEVGAGSAGLRFRFGATETSQFWIFALLSVWGVGECNHTFADAVALCVAACVLVLAIFTADAKRHEQGHTYRKQKHS